MASRLLCISPLVWVRICHLVTVLVAASFFEHILRMLLYFYFPNLGTKFRWHLNGLQKYSFRDSFTDSFHILSFCVKLDQSDSFIYWEVRKGVKIWKVAQAISGRLHLHTLVMATPFLSVKPKIPRSSMSEICYSGTTIEESWEAMRWQQNLCICIYGLVCKSTCAFSAGGKSSPLSDSVSGARLPERSYFPIQEEGVSGTGYS